MERLLGEAVGPLAKERQGKGGGNDLSSSFVDLGGGLLQELGRQRDVV